MNDFAWLVSLLDSWGVWARGTDSVGYRSVGLGRLIRKRQRDVGTGTVIMDIEVSLSDDQAMPIDRAVADLPLALRAAVKMRYVHTLPNVRAAARLRVSESTFKRYVRRAHGLLASQLRRASSGG